jgi:hypothetical protein
MSDKRPLPEGKFMLGVLAALGLLALVVIVAPRADVDPAIQPPVRPIPFLAPDSESTDLREVPPELLQQLKEAARAERDNPTVPGTTPAPESAQSLETNPAAPRPNLAFEDVLGTFPLQAIMEWEFNSGKKVDRSAEDDPNLGNVTLTADSIVCPLGTLHFDTKKKIEGAPGWYLHLQPNPEDFSCNIGIGGVKNETVRISINILNEDRSANYFFNLPLKK